MTTKDNNWALFPMAIGTLWALVNDGLVRDRLETVLGDESETFVRLVRRIAMSFYERGEGHGSGVS